MARGHALGPSKAAASRGAPTHASAAIGRAAAAQIFRTRPREYCGRSSASTPTVRRAGVVAVPAIVVSAPRMEVGRVVMAAAPVSVGLVPKSGEAS